MEDALYVSQKAVSVADDGTTRVVKKLMPDGTYLEIPVKLGMQAGSDVQIISDQLKEGDEVAVNKVTSQFSNNNLSFGNMININIGAPSGGGRPGGGGAGGGRPSGGGRPR